MSNIWLAHPQLAQVVYSGGLVNKKWWIFGLTALVLAGGVLILRQLKGSRPAFFSFSDTDDSFKNFGAFPPDIPESEFDEANFFS